MDIRAVLDLIEDAQGAKLQSAQSETVRLYHGTNDQMAADIERYGFRSGGGETSFIFLKDLARQALGANLPPKLVAAIKKHAGMYHSGSIFFSPSKQIASEHARKYGPTGGEMGSELLGIMQDEIGFEGEIFPGARPAVITVDLPRSWLHTEFSAIRYEMIVHREEIDPSYIAEVELV